MQIKGPHIAYNRATIATVFSLSVMARTMHCSCLCALVLQTCPLHSCTMSVYYLIYAAAQPIAGSQYGYTRVVIAPYDVVCNGSERRLEDCALSFAPSSFCDDPSTSSAGVICSYRDCKSDS